MGYHWRIPIVINSKTAAENAEYTGYADELVYLTDRKTLVIHDNRTRGGIDLLESLHWLRLEQERARAQLRRYDTLDREVYAVV